MLRINRNHGSLTYLTEVGNEVSILWNVDLFAGKCWLFESLRDAFVHFKKLWKSERRAEAVVIKVVKN